MAIIRDPKDPKGLMAALGPTALGMSSSEENLIGDEPTYTNNDETFSDVEVKKKSNEVLQEVERKLDNTIKLVQEISKKSGLQKDEVYKILSNLATALQNNVQKTVTSALDVINPVIKKELIQITSLLDTGSVSDQEKAMIKLEELQKKFNLDLKKYNENLGINLDKLNAAVEKMAADKKEKIEEAKKLQTSELSQGRSARIDEKSANLRYLSRDEIKAEEIKARNIEKEIIVQKKEFDKLLKQEGAFKDGKFDNEQQENLNNQRIKIEELEAKSAKIRSVIGDKQPGFLQKTGEVLRGERGPELVKQLIQPFYQGFSQFFKLLDDLTLGYLGKFGKKLIDIGGNIFTKNFGTLASDFSKGFTKFKENTLKSLKDVFGPVMKSLTDGLKSFGNFLTDGLKSLFGSGKGTTVGGVTGAMTSPSGVGVIPKGLGSSGSTGGGLARAGGGLMRAGGGLLRTLGGGLMRAALFNPIGLGITAAAAGAYGLKKLYDKKKEEGTLGGSYDESTGEHIPGGEEANKDMKVKELPYDQTARAEQGREKIRQHEALIKQKMGEADGSIKVDPQEQAFKQRMAEQSRAMGVEPTVDSLKFKFNGRDVDQEQFKQLRDESKEFVRGGKKDTPGINLFNQNAPTVNNAGDSKTAVSTSYINTNPTFTIINTRREF